MYDRIFVASGKRTQRKSWESLANLLIDELGFVAPVIRYADVEAIEAVRLNGSSSNDLLIVEADLPLNEDEPDDKGGFKLMNALQAQVTPPACILVAAMIDNDLLDTVSSWPRGRLLKGTSKDMLPHLTRFARELAFRKSMPPPPLAEAARKPAASAEGRPWALLEISLGGQRGSSFTLYTGRGATPCEPEYSPFELDEQELRRVIEKSREIRLKLSSARARNSEQYSDEFRKDCTDLGAQVFRLINQDRFYFLWGRANQAAESNARIRFTLDKDSYDGLWESIYDEKYKDWLILHGGISRRVRPLVSRGASMRTLDGGSGVINVLAIFSNITPEASLTGPRDPGWSRLKRELVMKAQRELGRMARTGDILAPLSGLAEEQAALDTLNHAETRRFHVDIVSSADVAGSGQSLAEKVRQALTTCKVPGGKAPKYDIVHFAGHALFHQECDPRGYLVFGDQNDTRAVPIAEFATWLRGAQVQLAYLNCCQSSASRAAFELAAKGVPLAVGFTWDLDTEKAKEFATEFYGHLAGNDSKVCQAFTAARNTFYDRNEEFDATWIAPVLVAQPDRWENVETCFVTAA